MKSSQAVPARPGVALQALSQPHSATPAPELISGSIWARRGVGLVMMLAAVCCAGTLGGLLGRWWWVLELTTHFRIQYALTLGVSAVLLLLLRRPWWFLVSLLFCLANASLVLPAYLGRPTVPGRGQPLRVLSLNVNVHNTRFSDVADLVRRTQPDFVLLLEATPRWVAQLQELRAEYRYFHAALPNGESGVIAYSRFPLERIDAAPTDGVMRRALAVRGSLADVPLTIIGLHAQAPFGPACARERNRQLAELAAWVKQSDQATIVLGDLNVTPWSPHFQDLLQQTGLRDSRRGFGIQATWPAGFPPLWIPIDHCLVSAEVGVRHRSVEGSAGSDHYSVLLDLSVVDRQ
jgi:endonuclease/exonuclease/phosphatase (EEP) superfamily protein YafD